MPSSYRVFLTKTLHNCSVVSNVATFGQCKAGVNRDVNTRLAASATKIVVQNS